MHVLILSQYFWPETFRITDVAHGLVERGHRVTVLTGIPNYPEGRFPPGYGPFRPCREKLGAIDIVRVPLVPRGNARSLRLVLNYLSFAFSACVFGPFLCRDRYDAILVFQNSPLTVGLPALVFNKLRRIPMYFWVQDVWPETLAATGAVSSPLILDAFGSLAKMFYRASRRVLIQSLAFRPLLEAAGVPPEKLVYFPNSAESFYVPLDPASAVLPVSLPEGFRVMFAGNVGVAQGFDTLLAAAELLRDDAEVQWLIVGDGRELAAVRERVARSGLERNFHFFGRHPVEDMPRWYAHADVLLVSLKRDPVFALTIPSKVQGYLATGRPVLASLDGEGARVVQESGAGLAVPAEDAAGLAAAVLALKGKSKDELQEMGRRGRAYFEAHFEREALLTQLDELLQTAR